MNLRALKDLFGGFSDEFRQFDRVEKKFSARSDLHAFMRLDQVLPQQFKIIDSATDGNIRLGINSYCFAEIATPELVKELVRCGVQIDTNGNFYMNV